MACFHRFRAICLFLCACALLVARPLSAQSRESDIKAAFVFNFAQFVEWPPSAFTSTNSPFIIGVLGANPFGPTLQELVKGEEVKGHPIQVRTFSSVNLVEECHILFISASEAGRLPQTLQALAARPILTVSDIERFAYDGGMIRFLKVENKVRFRINLAAAREAGLTISSKLLRLSDVLEETPRQP